ncbi:MAG TPA: sensor histidine kinase [Rhizomicrobium sp.]
MLAQVEATIPVTDFSPGLQGEADHRIANSLQIISSLVRQRAKSASIEDPKTFLLEIADRIATVGSLHLLLARSKTETVQLSSYLREVCDRLTDALLPTATSVSFDCARGIALPSRTALPLALITAELVSNSLKYAHPTGLPTKITLSCRGREKGGLKLIYEDDGVGFPENFDVSAASHSGMAFIGLLSKSLRANHKWHSDPLGVCFEIELESID